MKQAALRRCGKLLRHQMQALQGTELQDLWRPGRATALPVSVWLLGALGVALLVWGTGWWVLLQGQQQALTQARATASSLSEQLSRSQRQGQAAEHEAEGLSQRQQAQMAFLRLLPSAPGLAELIDTLVPLLPPAERERWSVQAMAERQQGPVSVQPFRAQLRGSYAALSDFMQALVLLPRMVSSRDFSLEVGAQADTLVLTLGMLAYYCPDRCFPADRRADTVLSVTDEDEAPWTDVRAFFQGRDPFSASVDGLVMTSIALPVAETLEASARPGSGEYVPEQLRHVGRLEKAGRAWLLMATPAGQVIRVAAEEATEGVRHHPAGSKGGHLDEYRE